MPHVIVKMWPDRSDAEKAVMAAHLAEALHASLGFEPNNVSVAVEEIAPEDWMEKVYSPDIAGRQELLVKRPGYGPLA